MRELSRLVTVVKLWTGTVYIGQERRRVCLPSTVSWREFSVVHAALFKKEGLYVKVMKRYLKEK